MNYCWKCKTELNYVFDVDGEIVVPKQGEIAVCMLCCAPNIFDNGQFCKFSSQEIESLKVGDSLLYRDVTKIQIMVRNQISYAHN